MRYGVFAILVVAALAVGMGMAQAADPDTVIGHQYALTSVDGEAFASERDVFIEFGENYFITGRVCNAFRAPAAYSNGILKSEAIASTRMLCPDQGLSRLETNFLQSLQAGVSAVRHGDRLQLRRDASVWEFTLADKAAAEAASPGPVAAVVEPRQLTGRSFELVSVDGRDFSPAMGRQPFVAFSTPDNGLRLNGSACNSFTGNGEFRDGKLVMESAAATMMMCADPQLSGYERDFFRLLRDGVTVTLSGDTLTLQGGGRTFVYREK
ncbi:MAG: META domain-containing protein [Planctomycetaceae bacterium]|nr:META domain-containing protein [Planctomycetaceae bacterium]